ncbi:MAG: DUF2975 domain-containing protein [Balneolaceae bacterium]|nr:DUF2975 domain-containing protein [Balneolaceae bacterium]
MKTKLQNDWTLAHFISYIAAITAVLLGIQLIIQIYLSSSFGMEFPVKYSVENSNQLGTHLVNGETYRMTLVLDQQQEGRLLILEAENGSDIHSLFLIFLKIIESGMFIYCAFLVWQIFRAVARDQPFSESNYKRLFILGWIFILAELIALGRAFYVEWLTFDAFSSEPFELIRTPDNFYISLFIGIMIIVIGYVFKEGHRIYQEQQLTV